MAIHDVDRTNADRGTPMPNTHDSLDVEQRMAHGTVSITPVTDATDQPGYAQTKNSRLLINDGAANRAIAGARADGNVGFFVSPEGVDVDTADLSQLLFNSNQSAFKVVQVNTIVNPSGQSDNPDIQAAIDNVASLGGVVFLKNGTYLMDSNIVVPSGVTLQGETIGGVVLDFQQQAFQMQVVGDTPYSDGTVAATNASTAVTGTGTAWDPSMIGQSILLFGVYYGVADVVDATTITIDAPFEYDTFSGRDYVIANLNSDVSLTNFTVQNSLHADGAILFQYASGFFLSNINVYGSTIGINYLQCSGASSINFLVAFCGTGTNVNNCGAWTFYNFEVYGSLGVAMQFNELFSASINDFTISTTTGDGISATSSQLWGLYDFTMASTTGAGIELSSCSNIQIFSGGIQNGGADGLKLTTGDSYISVHNTTFDTNVGWGINIANNTSSSNTLTDNFFISNTAGDIMDAGVNTTTDHDLVLIEAPTNQSYTGTVVRLTYGVSLVPGDLVYFDPTGVVKKADADGVSTYPCLGLALETASSGSHRVLLHGIYRDDSLYAWTVGGLVYLSKTAGAATQVQPSATDDVIQVIGIATHADRIYFNPSMDHITHT